MLKKFFFQVLTSFMGAWLAIVMAGIAAVIVVIGLVGSLMSGEDTSVHKDSVLKITLEGTLEERDNGTSLNLMELMSGDGEKVQTVETLTVAIQEAKENGNIKCIYLDCKGIAGAPASLNAVREALIRFKTSKKKIYAYADTYTGADYFLASVADEIVLNPVGQVQFHGLGGISLFFKDLFDKIGVEFQAVRVGKGKAAVEPYTSSEMSEVARQQSLELYRTIWNGMATSMAKARKGFTAAGLDTLISVDLISCRPAKFILANKLVTKLEYRHAFEARLAKVCGHKDELKNIVSPSQLAQQHLSGKLQLKTENQIALLYACGGIDMGFSSGGINSEELSEQIYELMDDDDVKALVLRVNSPGGSAFGSEQIWEALEKFKASGKPFIVSMGDFAASGGYYISCGAQRIFADPYTITGSIGIYGLIPNISGLCQKLGVNPQMIATNPQALFPNMFYPMNEQQLSAMQSMVENGYNLFVKRCADGRKMTVAKLSEIADGRPIAATTAKTLGLVDEIKPLDDAIAYAARQAKLEKWNVVSYPNAGNPLQEFMKQLEQQQSAMTLINESDPKRLAEKVMPMLDSFSGTGAIQALMPMIIFSY